MTTVRGLELIDPRRYASHGYPHDEWAELRREAPVHYFEPEGYDGFWALTRHEDIVEVSRKPEIFANGPRLLILDQASDAVNRAGPRLNTVVNMDPPDHIEYRKIAGQWLTPRNVRKIEDRMMESARQLVDWIAERGPDAPFDFVPEIATPHPLRLIARLFGLPEEDEPRMLRLTNEVFGAADPEFARDGETGPSAATIAEALHWFESMVEDRKRTPQDDLASAIAHATVRDAPIGAHEILSYYWILLSAGHDTTRNALSGGLLALIEHPDQLEALRRDPALFQTAPDEIVRWTSPVNQFARTAMQDYELRGQKIRAGESLALFYASANRDETVFEDPFAFRLDRKPNPHLGFGIGAHFCLGATLAKMEIRVLLEELIPRLESVELAGPPERLISSFVGGVKHLPVRMHVRPA